MINKPAKSLRKDSNGIIAVEMAFILPILIFLIFTIIEYSVLFYLSSRIESAANEAARLGITGNLYGATNRKELLEKRVEDNLAKVVFKFDPRKLVVRANSLNDYNITAAPETDPNNFGSGAEFTLYQVSYEWKLLTPLLSYGMGDKNGQYKLSARVIVKNEEF